MNLKSYRRRAVVFAIACVCLYLGWRYLQKQAGFQQMDAALRRNNALGVPRCGDQTMDAFADQWAKMSGFDRESIARGLLNYCGPILPWTQYRIVDVLSRETLATVSRSGGIELR